MAAARVVLAGSAPAQTPGARLVGAADPEARMQVTVHLRSKMPGSELARYVENLSSEPVGQRQYLTREQLGELRGAEPAAAEQIGEFARSYGLNVVAVDLPSRTVELKGTVQNFERAFGTKLLTYEARGAEYIAPESELRIPADVAGVIEAVLGLNNGPVARPRN